MGIFDKLQKRVNEASEALAKKCEELAKYDYDKKNQELTEKIDKKSNSIFEKSEGSNEYKIHKSRMDIDSKAIDEMQRIPASDRYCRKIYKELYRGYPEMPYISKDRELNSNWVEQAGMFPIHSIIPIEKMTRFDDGLLPGHVYMLYWIGKKKKGRIPSYFEYKYGIDFVKEKQFLQEKNYLNGDELTEKGVEALALHFSVVDEHSPQQTSDREAKNKFADTENISVEQMAKGSLFTVGAVYEVSGRSLMIVDKEDYSAIEADIELLNNEILTKIKGVLDISTPLKVPAELLSYNQDFDGKLGTYFQYEPVTPKGKRAKYPYILYYAIENHFDSNSVYDAFGHIGYLQDGRMGSAWMNFWHNKEGYHIDLALVSNKLTVKKVEKMTDGGKVIIYKK